MFNVVAICLLILVVVLFIYGCLKNLGRSSSTKQAFETAHNHFMVTISDDNCNGQPFAGRRLAFRPEAQAGLDPQTAGIAMHDSLGLPVMSLRNTGSRILFYEYGMVCDFGGGPSTFTYDRIKDFMFFEKSRKLSFGVFIESVYPQHWPVVSL